MGLHANVSKSTLIHLAYVQTTQVQSTHSLYQFIISLPYPAVSISLEQSVYSVAEADGFVEVCVVLQGQLARNVNVELRTMGDTASEFVLVTDCGTIQSSVAQQYR